ncbi:probable crossover junction endonuclease EME2 [Pelobates cultripes]|uniref:Probable crossover junction endonuclease EME2 n=1 Tax=Pelobates cultripes TaxID=61616 RepID=A0AAD1SQD7_PELCU|nr:probable crossover junction endonuclease EME2 [Pelobates cultripes]
MEEGQNNLTSIGSAASPSKLVKRPITWELSESENEEDHGEDPREHHACPVLQIDTNVPKVMLSGVEEEAQEPVSFVESSGPALALPLPGGTTPSPVKRTRKKKTSEELEAEKVEAEEKKKAREAKKQEKARKKDLERLEKERRKHTAAALKLLRPDQCVKYMIVQVDAGLLEDTGSEDVLEVLRSSGYAYSIEPHSVPQSFTWRREMPSDWTCVEGLELSVGEEDCILIVVQPGDFLRSVSVFAQSSKYSSIGDQSFEVLGSLFGISKQLHQKQITLIVIGFKEYQWCHKLSRQMERHSLQQKDCDIDEGSVTRNKINEALVFLQLSLKTEVLFVDTWRDLGQHVCAVTKSLAQRPSRKHWESQSFSFCTSAGTWKGWGPRGALNGLPLAWKRQIQQLNRVSPAMAAAVTDAYPSPQLLMKAYDKCGTEREKITLLSNLRVPQDHNAVATDDVEGAEIAFGVDQAPGKERRIGPDLSRRIWLFMTSLNPDMVLDLNS